MNAFRKSMDTKGAVDSRGAGCLRRAFGLSNTRCLTTFGRSLLILLVLFVGAAAAPTTAQAAGCSGTGECYWVGGTGSWSDTTHWATLTGGVVTGGLPTSADNAHFNAYSNTTAYTVTVDTTATMLDLMFDAAPSESGTITFTNSSGVTVYGSFKALAGTSPASFMPDTFAATSAGKTITMAGHTYTGVGVTFNGVGGEWTLQDDLLKVSGPIITLTNGTLNTNGKTVQAARIWSGAGGTLTLGASSVTVGEGSQSDWSVSGMTLNADTSTINFVGGKFSAAGLTYYTVVLSGNGGYVDGSGTFTNLTYNSTVYNTTLNTAQTVTGTLTLSGVNAVLGVDQTISGTLVITGTSPSSRSLISSSVAGTARTITAAAVSLTDVDFTDITGAGAAAPFTGTRLGNATGNSGITFTTSANKYYIGNTANWNGTVWALTSGGAAGANNFPLPQDTAIFDANSFSADSQTVTVGDAFRLPAILFSGTDQTHTFATGTNAPTYYGDVTLDANTTISGTTGAQTFVGRNTQTITSTGVAWTQPLTVDSIGGTVTLGDAFTTAATRTTTLTNGTLNLNGQTLSTGLFSSSNSNTRAITSGGGGITLTGNNATIFDISSVTGFTLNDALQVDATYSGATGTRIVTSNTNEANSPSIKFSAGTDIAGTYGPGFWKNLDFTGFSGSWLAGSISVYGNLTISTGMTIADWGGVVLTFEATSGTQVITSNSKAFSNSAITINAPGATVQLADNLTMGSTRTLTLTAGTLDLNGQTLSTGIFNTSGSTARTVTDSVGAGKIATTYTTAGTVFTAATPTNLTVDRTNPWTIEIGGDTTNVRTFAGGGATWPALTFTNTTASGQLNFTGSNTFKSLAVTTPPQTIKFTSSTNTTIEDTTTGFPSGTSGSLVTIGTISGTATLTKSGGGRVCSDYLAFSNITGSPSTLAWYVGANSTGSGTGLIFSACPSVPATNPVVPHATAGMLTATGGTLSTIVENGVTYRVHTFANAGTATFRVTGGSGNVQYLVVGGGGGGGTGGGGAGGFKTNSAYNYAVSNGSYTVTVGGGGVAGASGSNSVFDTITSAGGGAGANTGTGTSGGSGGGGGSNASTAGGSGTAGQGNGGGAGVTNFGGGGGGASAVGDAGTTQGGNGGAGTASSISGSSATYAGGGGGAGATPGSAGAGGGGSGSATTGADGTVNTGGGAGGGVSAGGSGGSGIVIIRYPINTSVVKSPTSSGLVGWWTLDSGDTTTSTTTDRSGKGNHGGLVNSPTKVAGKVGQALSFDGSTSYVDAGDITTADGGTALSVSLWAKQAALSIDRAFVAKWDYQTQGSWGIQTDNSDNTSLQVFVANALNDVGVNSVATASGSWSAGIWHHVVFTYQGGVVKVYIDGVSRTLTTSGTIPSSMQNSTATVKIGKFGGTLTRYFNGSIDDVRIYNRALSATEVAAIYNANASSQASVARTNTSQNSKVASGLVGLWSFDGADMAGTSGMLTAYDRSGQGNTATSTGGVTKVIGKVGQALSFNGSSGYMDTRDIDAIDGSTTLTVSTWIKTNTASVNQNIISKWDYQTQGTFAMGLGAAAAGKLSVWLPTSLIDSGTGDRTDTTSAVIQSGSWYHVAFVFDGSETGDANRMKIYVNGASVATTQFYGNVPAALTSGGTATIKIGKFGGTLTRYFNGTIDDVRIYNRALTASEIKLLYNSGK